mmetsp:Transcript_13729/g.28705  ORF Transcript_13729/g.28705 Transcript_13729/m.28705 type:complete len:124 (-) Transcript_13729:14-385(-)
MTDAEICRHGMLGVVMGITTTCRCGDRGTDGTGPGGCGVLIETMGAAMIAFALGDAGGECGRGLLMPVAITGGDTTELTGATDETVFALGDAGGERRRGLPNDFPVVIIGGDTNGLSDATDKA